MNGTEPVLPENGLQAAPDDPRDDLVIFVEEDPAPAAGALPRWKIAVIDDDAAVQDGTRYALFDYTLDGHGLELLSARSAAEGRALFAAHPDIAVVLLDVVMESETAGLELVDHIRRTLKNEVVRIVLRTGQPGQAPERSVIVDYDINDYKAKTELTAARLFTTMTAALRGYQQLHRMVATRRGLEIIIEATATLGNMRSLRLLAEGVLTQIASLLDVDCAGILVLREGGETRKTFAVIAGSGVYRDAVGGVPAAPLDAPLLRLIDGAFAERRSAFLEERTVLFVGTGSGAEIVVVLDSGRHLSETDRALLGIFCNRLSASLDNLILYEQLQEANRTLEQRVVARTGDLATANRRMQEEWQRARQAAALQNEILGTVAHDLKNPLSTVVGRTEILTQLFAGAPVEPAQVLAQVEQVQDAARRMIAMVDTVVADAMAQAQDVSIRREPGDLVALLHQVVEANRTLAERKGQVIAITAPAALPARFDFGRLRDALDNLVSNAVKYSPIGADISTVAFRAGGDAVIQVVDEGPGLTPEDFGRLFGRFQRLSARPTGGESSTGLGLFSAKRIVEMHGGVIGAASPGAGAGTTFTITLPLDGAAAR